MSSTPKSRLGSKNPTENCFNINNKTNLINYKEECLYLICFLQVNMEPFENRCLEKYVMKQWVNSNTHINNFLRKGSKDT